MLTGAIIGLIVAVSITLWQRSNAKKGTGTPGQVEAILRASPQPMTLKEVAQAMNRNTFFGRGEVGQALAALQSTGKLVVHPAPEGTPQLKKVDVVRYELKRS
jgi:hypothetical protein